ncbi:MAG: FAD-dependent oxidoreductase, partial [Cellvibrionaceae bacterium]|nr:FAD-dependent oxidoreductase [Cellvibrionaceae bacterium]
DCELRLDGAYYTATNSAQHGLMGNIVDELKAANINQWQPSALATLQNACGSKQHSQGFYSPLAGSLQPAKLARGLMTVAKALGVHIYEHSPMQKLLAATPSRLYCPGGSVKAKQVVLASNAWLPRQFTEFSRAVVLVSSDMIISKPIPEQLAALGLDHGAAVIDSRTFVHYYRSTPDGRLMLGKGGNYFPYGNRYSRTFEGQSPYKELLKTAVHRFFPSIEPSQFEQTWTGASDRSATGFPCFGYYQNNPDIVYGFGYSGNGVVQTFIGAEIIKSLILKQDNPWSRSGLAQGIAGLFPPEPIRTPGAWIVRNAIRRKEQAEDDNRVPNWLDCQLAKLASSAGKAG